MKVSGFTFLRNGEIFGYPFVESIKSALPIVDEFVIALGASEDNTEQMVRDIGDPKIRIIPTTWNDNIRNDRGVKGFVYGQQKSTALFNCTGDWALYLEGDEVLHEDDYEGLHKSMETHLNDDRVEALAFDYLHFYGNGNTYAWSPRWYRKEPRIIRNNIPVWGPKGLFFVVLETQKKGRYPYGAPANARIFHYGWVSDEAKFNALRARNEKYWSDKQSKIDYAEVDPRTLREFTGTHPTAIQRWLPPAEGMFQANPDHVLSRREKKHRVLMKLEDWFGLDFTPKHYRKLR